MDCPKCIGKLSKVELKIHEGFNTPKGKQGRITSFEVDQCFVCQGIWFDAGELEKYIEYKGTVLDSPSIDIGLMADFDEKVAKCPVCGKDMDKKKAPLNENITIDFCKNCNGIWLDSTEIDRLEKKNFTFWERLKFAWDEAQKDIRKRKGNE